MLAAHLLQNLYKPSERPVYSTKDKILDAIAACLLTAAFIMLWSAAAIMDLAITGM